MGRIETISSHGSSGTGAGAHQRRKKKKHVPMDGIPSRIQVENPLMYSNPKIDKKW